MTNAQAQILLLGMNTKFQGDPFSLDSCNVWNEGGIGVLVPPRGFTLRISIIESHVTANVKWEVVDEMAAVENEEIRKVTTRSHTQERSVDVLFF
ncbi:hypothetical protein PISMIDRAFT_18428 [Pisolithus microcarpus 441]|uniref:Uncharacterized protein n=1 Tax=Pisolithus microcarpus 441 TaxID=765257 RepID=A0A0C9Y7G1_9AGAM|nr:hypothetical protein BKA83DRAFT_18428 [Pisolithus microcarpus]KIK12866.1 hypothetical protein PISMIDRAFT_18428 [Pisolithus microcarpus 441]